MAWEAQNDDYTDAPSSFLFRFGFHFLFCARTKLYLNAKETKHEEEEMDI